MSNSKWSRCTMQSFIDSGEAETKTGPFGTQLKASEYVEHGTPVINVRNIGFGTIRPDKLEYLAPETVERLSTHLLQPHDIVFGRKGAVERHVFIRPEQKNWFQGSDCLRLRLKSKRVDPRFVSYFLLTDDHKQWMMNQCSHGVTMASLNQEIIWRIPLLLPDILVQRKIASILSAYDDLIENNTRRIAILEAMAQAIYREWFVEFRFPGHEKVKLVDSPLGKIPDGWKISPLKEVYRTSSGGTPSRKVDEYYDGGTINWVKTKELDDRFIWDTEEKITGAGLTNSSAKLFPANTVIMAMYGATIGQLGILGAESTTNQACCGFLTNQSQYGYPYLFLALLANRSDIINLRAGAAQQNVSQDVIREMPFLVPPIAVVRSFNEFAEPFLKGVFSLQRKNVTLRKTRDLLLPKLISGTLDVEDLDIETGENVTVTE